MVVYMIIAIALQFLVAWELGRTLHLIVDVGETRLIAWAAILGIVLVANAFFIGSYWG